MNSPAQLRIIAIAALLLLSACGGAPATPEPTQDLAAPIAPAATHTHPPATNAPTQAPAEEVEILEGQVNITLANFAFTPKNIAVRVGTTVTWQNADFAPHTVTADDGSFGSNTLGDGDSFVFMFTEVGVFDYHCQFHGGTNHSGMSGTITVVE